jgi:DNA-binding response OmpR family regulator
MFLRSCAASLHGFTDSGSKRTHLSTSAVFQSPYANPILLVDPDVELGRGLLHQLARHGFCADLAITVDTARTCLWHRDYHAMVVIADPSDSRVLFGLRQLREAAPRTWMVVLTNKTAEPASQVAPDLGCDAYLLQPFRFSDLLFRLESLAHQVRTA